MPATTVQATERVFTRARQHRLPRGADPGYSDIATLPTVPASPVPPSTVYHVPLPVLPVSWPDASHPLTFGFWAGSDLASWYTVEPPTLPFVGVADTAPETAVRAWFCDLSGVGGVGGDTFVMLDELFLNTGDLLDDADFVAVISDPGLNAQANTDGWVPTAGPVTLRATASYAGPQPYEFYGWQIIGSGVSVPLADPTRLDVAAGAYGVALAVYASPTRTTVDIPPLRFPDVSIDEAVTVLLALRNNPTTGPLGDTLGGLANNELIRMLGATMATDDAAAMAKILDQAAVATLESALKSLTGAP